MFADERQQFDIGAPAVMLGRLAQGQRQLLVDSVEKVALAAASRSDVPAVEVAASHFKLPSGVSLS
ncbi:hypothetical protein ACIUX2_29490, partial [Pseudomonas aeruginosa]